MPTKCCGKGLTIYWHFPEARIVYLHSKAEGNQMRLLIMFFAHHFQELLICVLFCFSSFIICHSSWFRKNRLPWHWRDDTQAYCIAKIRETELCKRKRCLSCERIKDINQLGEPLMEKFGLYLLQQEKTLLSRGSSSAGTVGKYFPHIFGGLPWSSGSAVLTWILGSITITVTYKDSSLF